MEHLSPEFRSEHAPVPTIPGRRVRRSAAGILPSLIALALLLAACGDGSTEPTGTAAPEYPAISGSYLGTIDGVTDVEGVGTVELRDVDFTLTVVQNAGGLSGVYGLEGSYTIDWPDGSTTVGPISVIGTMTGTISTNGTISMSFVPSHCPTYTSPWSGRTTAGGFELSGTLERLDSQCVATVGMPVSVTLLR